MAAVMPIATLIQLYFGHYLNKANSVGQYLLAINVFWLRRSLVR